jgi:hypothetical protein
MAEHTSSQDPTAPNRASNKEPAEGSRENTDAGGISNRPSSEEHERQSQIPARGHSRAEEHEGNT